MERILRRPGRVIGFALGLAAALAGMAPAAAAEPAKAAAFPTRPVTLIVPYPAGGGTDVVSRTLGQALARHWQQPVIVENVSGADGLIGTRRALQQPADGHTLLVQVNPMLMWPVTLPTADVDLLRDTRLITRIQHSPLTLSTAVPFEGRTLADFLRWCRSPGRHCTSGAATSYGHLAGRHLLDLAGLDSTRVIRYRGTAPMLTDVLGKHLELGMITVTSALAHAGKGDFKVLAVGSRERFAALPEVPTLIEQGFAVEADVWYGMMVAKDTPEAIVRAISDGVRAVAGDPDLLRTIRAGGGEPIFDAPETFEAALREEIRALTPLLERYPVGN